jgi:hypothetical protein
MADPTNLSPADQAAMQPETFVNPMVKALMERGAANVAKPGQLMENNPYKPGSEEHAWYQDQQNKGAIDWATKNAGSLIGGGMPMAKPGSLGMAGGRTVMPGAVPLRGPGGTFLKPMADARGMPNPFIPEAAGYKIPKPGEVAPTTGPSNPMYTPETAPDMAAAKKLLERKQTDQLNVNPADVERWKSTMPLNVTNPTPEPTPSPETTQLIKALLGK